MPRGTRRRGSNSSQRIERLVPRAREARKSGREKVPPLNLPRPGLREPRRGSAVPTRRGAGAKPLISIGLATAQKGKTPARRNHARNWDLATTGEPGGAGWGSRASPPEWRGTAIASVELGRELTSEPGPEQFRLVRSGPRQSWHPQCSIFTEYANVPSRAMRLGVMVSQLNPPQKSDGK